MFRKALFCSLVPLSLVASVQAAGTFVVDREITASLTRDLARAIANECVEEIEATAADTTSDLVQTANAALYDIEKALNGDDRALAQEIAVHAVEALDLIAHHGAAQIDQLAQDCVGRLNRLRGGQDYVGLVLQAAEQFKGSQISSFNDPRSIYENLTTQTQRVLEAAGF